MKLNEAVEPGIADHRVVSANSMKDPALVQPNEYWIAGSRSSTMATFVAILSSETGGGTREHAQWEKTSTLMSVHHRRS